MSTPPPGSDEPKAVSVIGVPAVPVYGPPASAEGGRLLTVTVVAAVWVRPWASETTRETVKVPGSFEIPLMAKKMTQRNKYDAIICLGAVIRGSTPHFEYVSAEVSKGIASVSLESGVPVIFGVITTDTLEQAIERAGSKSGNKGWAAAVAAMEMAHLVDALDRT